MKKEIEKLTNLLDDLSKGYNPNYQDMAVKGAVMAYRSWKRGSEGDDAEEVEEVKEEEGAADAVEAVKLKQLFEEGDWPMSKLRDIADEDPLTLLDDENFQGSSASQESGIRELIPMAVARIDII
jgi:protein kinase C substrate 80K-H